MQKYVSPEATLVRLSLVDVIMASAAEGSPCVNETGRVPLALNEEEEPKLNTQSLV